VSYFVQPHSVCFVQDSHAECCRVVVTFSFIAACHIFVQPHSVCFVHDSHAECCRVVVTRWRTQAERAMRLQLIEQLVTSMVVDPAFV